MVGRTQHRNPAAVALNSLVEAEVAGSKQRSAKWKDCHSEVPGGKANVGGAVELEETVVCRSVGCKSQSVVSFRVWAYSEKHLFGFRS